MGHACSTPSDSRLCGPLVGPCTDIRTVITGLLGRQCDTSYRAAQTFTIEDLLSCGIIMQIREVRG